MTILDIISTDPMTQAIAVVVVGVVTLAVIISRKLTVSAVSEALQEHARALKRGDETNRSLASVLHGIHETLKSKRSGQ